MTDAGPSTDLKDISLDASGDQPLSNAAQDPMGGGAADAATGSSGADGVAAANAAPSHFAEQSETTASASALAFRRPSHEAGPSARGSLDGMRADVYALQQGQPSYTNIEVRPSDTHGGPNFYTITAVSQTGKHAEAARRFNDLVALHENLKVSYRGCVIPFRPGKTFANSTALRNHKGSFLRDRAYAIRCYLIKVTRHPDIKDSPALKQFMESEEVLSASTVWAAEQPHRTTVMTGFVKSMKKLVGSEPRIPTPSQVEAGGGKTEHDVVQQMAEMRISRKTLHTAADSEEKALLEIGDMLSDMVKANQAFATAATALVDGARALLDGLQAMYNYEKDWEGPARLHMAQRALDTLAACIDTFGRCISKENTTALTRLEAVLEPINDHAFSLPRVEKALAARLNALVVLESLKRQEGIINATYQQLSAKERSGAMSNADVRRMNRVRSETDQVAQAKAAGQRTFDLLKTRNTRDIEWYRAGRAAQFRDMVARFASAQAALCSAAGDLWLAMATRTGADVAAAGPDLENVVLADLGKKVSHSAVLLEPEAAAAPRPAALDGPLPAEHAEVA